MANMTFKANLLPSNNLGYTLGQTDKKWKVYGDLIGNADTATKLSISRNLTIGNATKSFDGSANISYTHNEIGVIAKETISEAVDFNTLAATKIYIIKNTACANQPTTNHGILFSCNDVGTQFQLWAPDNAMTVYKRYYLNSDVKWGSWAALSQTPLSHTHSYLPYSEVTSMDANNATSGIYSCRCSVTNAPVTNHGVLVHFQAVGTPFQLFMPDNINYIYKRWYTSGAWVSWRIMNAAWA